MYKFYLTCVFFFKDNSKHRNAHVQGGASDLQVQPVRGEQRASLHWWPEGKMRYQGLYFLSFNSTKLVPNRRTARLNFLLFWLLIADSTNCLVQVRSYRNQRESEYASFIKEPFPPLPQVILPLMWKLSVFVIYSKLIAKAAVLVKHSRWRLDSSARPPVKKRNWSIWRTGPLKKPHCMLLLLVPRPPYYTHMQLAV